MVRPPTQTVVNLPPRRSTPAKCSGLKACPYQYMRCQMATTCIEHIPSPTLVINKLMGIQCSKGMVIDTVSPAVLSTTMAPLLNMASQTR